MSRNLRYKLKGITWGHFFDSDSGVFYPNGKYFHFKLRVGYFFNIYACAIIYQRQYVVLRKVPLKAMKNFYRLNIMERRCPFDHLGGPWMKMIYRDSELRGDWWCLHNFSTDVKEQLTGQFHGAYVLAPSKHDLLERY